MDNVEDKLLEIEENLHKWFKEKWVRFGPDGKIRGQCAREKSSEGKPKCRPLKSAQAMGKKGRAKAARRKRREDPNPDRSGKAKNVKTEEIMNENHICPICGGELVSEVLMNEKKDACYYKVKSRYKVWPSAYASGALVKCRKKGAKNWGTKSEGFEEVDEACWKGYHKEGMKTMFGKKYPNCVKNKKNEQEELNEKWSEKYKRSINCNNPKGFSQKAHCQGRKKTEEQIMKEEQLKNIIREMVIRELKESHGKNDKGSVIYSDDKYEMYRTSDSYDEEPKGEMEPNYSILDDFTFSIRNKATKQDLKIARGEFRSPSYFLMFDVHSTPFSTPKQLIDFLKKFTDAPELGIDALENFLGDDSWSRPRPNSPEFLKYINNLLKSGKTSLNEDVDECWECYEAAMEEGSNEAYEECYKKTNWNMVPEGEEHTCEGDEFYEIYGDMNADAKENLEEAEYRGRKVKLGKPMRGDVKKFKVFVRNPQTGKVKKVNFGDKKMRIKKSNPKRRKSFRARHNCANPGPRTKARYWSCRKW